MASNDSPQGTPPDGREFTEDYVSMHVANWRNWLEPFTDKPAVRALEIGSFEGRSALWFLENVLTHPTARLTCMDCHFGLPFLKNIRTVRHKIKIMHGHSGWLLRKPVFRPNCFSFIYIDGGHRSNEVLEDAVLAFRLLATGGIMIFDDYEWTSPTPDVPQSMPRIAIDGFLAAFEKEIHVIHKGWQVAIQKRRADKWPADLPQRIAWFIDELLGRPSTGISNVEDTELYYAFFKAHSKVDAQITASTPAAAAALSASTAALYHISTADLVKLTAEIRKYNVDLGSWCLTQQDYLYRQKAAKKTPEVKFLVNNQWQWQWLVIKAHGAIHAALPPASWAGLYSYINGDFKASLTASNGGGK
jgi:hypothetical protein